MNTDDLDLIIRAITIYGVAAEQSLVKDSSIEAVRILQSFIDIRLSLQTRRSVHVEFIKVDPISSSTDPLSAEI